MHWLSDELSELLEDFDILDETHLKKLSGLLSLAQADLEDVLKTFDSGDSS